MDWVEGNALTRTVDKATSRVDSLLSLASNWYLELRYRQVKRKAIEVDPRYARIEAERHENTAGFLMLNGGSLGWDEWHYQMDVESAVIRRNWLDGLARWAGARPFTVAFNNFVAARQRKQRGWDFRAVYSLDYHIASTLGPQLLELAERMPYRDGDWLDELRASGNALVRYSRKDDETLLDDVATSEDRASREDEINAAAKNAMHWVADNFERLWN